MARALDPYHRIRAAVGAIFLLSVLVMALVTMHGPARRATVSVGAVSGQAVTTAPTVGSAVSAVLAAPVPSAAPVSGAVRVAGSAAAHPRPARTH